MKRLSVAVLVLFPLFTMAQTSMSKEELSAYIAQQSPQISTAWRENRIQDAVDILEKLYAIPKLREIDWAWTSTLYNLTCGYSLLGNTEKSLSFLSEAIAAGYSDYEQIARDSDLDNIRSDDRFGSLIKPLKMGLCRWESPSFQSNDTNDLPETQKIAGLSKVWSEIKYGFVYFDRSFPLDWDSLYVANLAYVANTKSTLEYYRLLQKMCAQLKDGHTTINPPNELFLELYAHPALQTSLVEDKVLIVKVLDDSLEKTGIAGGIEIIRVDGMPVKEYAEEFVAPYTNFSTTQGQLAGTYGYYLLCGSKHKPVELELRNKKGDTFKRIFPRNRFRIQSFTKAIEFNVLKKNIAYVALNTFGDRSIIGKFDSLFTRIGKTDGLILDLRENAGGNSDIAYEILGYFVDRPFTIVQGKSRDYNSFYRSMGKKQNWVDNPSVELPPNGSKYYSKPISVLIGSHTGSAAEDFCAVFHFLKRGKMIGTRTTGSTGQPLVFSLPGGGTGTVCTNRASTPDGKEFVGIGIEPDIPVQRTVLDVQHARDPEIDIALELLKSVQ